MIEEEEGKLPVVYGLLFLLDFNIKVENRWWVAYRLLTSFLEFSLNKKNSSGLAVRPNPDLMGDNPPDAESIFRLAERTTRLDGSDDGDDETGSAVRRTITMYRDGFMVDDGPYRRLDDPANADFLRSLARGQTPRELMEMSSDDSTANKTGDVVVQLIDKRSEDYVPVFQSFSGAGTSLGIVNTSTDGRFDPAALRQSAAPANDGPTTSIQVRLLNGQRRVISIALNQTVTDLARQLVVDDESEQQSFRLVTGFPPKPIVDITSTIEAAGLKGAQVTMQKA